MPRITLSFEQLTMLENALRIAEEDGSIYGGAEEHDEYVSKQIDLLRGQLRNCIRNHRNATQNR